MVFDPIMPYSKGLMNSIIVPEEGTRGHVLMAIPGAPPNLKFRPSGCRFSERCRYAASECHKEPAKEQYGGSQGRSYLCRYKLEELFHIYEKDLPNLLDNGNGENK
jgi:peptide/nickel transport system ATP-binding protein